MARLRAKTLIERAVVAGKTEMLLAIGLEGGLEHIASSPWLRHRRPQRVGSVRDFISWSRRNAVRRSVHHGPKVPQRRCSATDSSAGRWPFCEARRHGALTPWYRATELDRARRRSQMKHQLPPLEFRKKAEGRHPPMGIASGDLPKERAVTLGLDVTTGQIRRLRRAMTSVAVAG